MDLTAATIHQALVAYRQSRIPSNHISLQGLNPSVKTNTLIRDDVDELSNSFMTEHVVGSSAASLALDMELDASKDFEDSEELDESRVSESAVDSDVVGPLPEASEVAVLFATQAAAVLAFTEVKSLIRFLERPKEEIPNNAIRAALQARIDKFYEEELQLTGEPKDRLVTPSGPEEAEIGILLHCQSKEDNIGQFWDLENRSIQLLSAQGFCHQSDFGFDWHWRAEESAVAPGRGKCPAIPWSEDKRALHDKMSSDLLSIVPLPWLLIGGLCPQKNFQKTLSGHVRRLTISVPGVDDINFDIDFHDGEVRRIIAYMPHPTAGIWHPSCSANYAAKLELFTGLFLWLHGRECGKGIFISCQAEAKTRRSPVSALPELRRYRKNEKKRGKILAEHEYTVPFLKWVGKYLQEDPSRISARGQSIAEAALNVVNDKISGKAKLRYAESKNHCRKAGTRSAAKRYGHTLRPFWDGQSVKVTQKGFFTLFVSTSDTSMKLSGGNVLARAAHQSPVPVTIHFLDEEIQLRKGAKVIFRRSLASITEKEERELWVNQHRAELAEKKALR